MTRFSHPIVQEVAALELPRPDQVVINHGSALVVRGLRDEHDDGDIDILTSEQNIHYLRDTLGWQEYDNAGKRAVQDDARRFDVHAWDAVPGGRLQLADEIERSEQDETTGIWVASLELVRETKLGTGRPQDEKDIDLIDRHTVR